MTDDSDGAKEWVTVKVPNADKEKADEYRPDGSTFGDCLVSGAERLNDNLDSDTGRFADTRRENTARQVVKDIRDNLGLCGDVDIADAVADRIGRAEGIDTDELADELAERIDYPELQDTETIARRLESLESIESRIGSIERTLEQLEGQR